MLTPQEGSWHWKQTVQFKNQGSELTEISGHSHPNILHYLESSRILKGLGFCLLRSRRKGMKEYEKLFIFEVIYKFLQIKVKPWQPASREKNWRSQWQYWDNILIFFCSFFFPPVKWLVLPQVQQQRNYFSPFHTVYKRPILQIYPEVLTAANTV